MSDRLCPVSASGIRSHRFLSVAAFRLANVCPVRSPRRLGTASGRCDVYRDSREAPCGGHRGRPGEGVFRRGSRDWSGVVLLAASLSAHRTMINGSAVCIALAATERGWPGAPDRSRTVQIPAGSGTQSIDANPAEAGRYVRSGGSRKWVPGYVTAVFLIPGPLNTVEGVSGSRISASCPGRAVVSRLASCGRSPKRPGVRRRGSGRPAGSCRRPWWRGS